MRPRNEDTKLAIYDYICHRLDTYGVSPTTAMIAREVGITPSSVPKYVKRLIDEGALLRTSRYGLSRARDPVSVRRMPIIGEVACGKPRLAVEDILGYLPVDDSLTGADHFGLYCVGDSMTEVGICEGDVVYVRRQDTADDGDIVVALVEDEFSDESYATLKRFFRDEQNKRYILHPENRKMQDIVLDRVRIIGKAVRVYKNIEKNPI